MNDQVEVTTVGLARAHALEAHRYVGEAALDTDRHRVLARSWQMVARSEQLAEPGDHRVEDVAGLPILVLRNEAGELRAFPNVCRHRAGPLVNGSGRGLKSLRCRYHGWLYSLDGRLVAAPEMQDAEDFDPREIRLPSLRVREWQGLVFVAIDPGTPDFDAVYGGIVERIAPIDLSTMRFVRRDHYEVRCNWKVYVDNFLEGYHLPWVHPGLSRVLDYREYDTELYPWYTLQRSPLRNAGDIYGDGEAFYYFVFPNVMLNIVPGRLQSNRILPLGPDRCRVEFDYFYAQTEDVLARIDNDRRFSDEIQHEDIAICEAVQKGLTSGFYEPGRLNPKRESGVWHFQELLRRAYAA